MLPIAWPRTARGGCRPAPPPGTPSADRPPSVARPGRDHRWGTFRRGECQGVPPGCALGDERPVLHDHGLPVDRQGADQPVTGAVERHPALALPRLTVDQFDVLRIRDADELDPAVVPVGPEV